MCRTYKYSKHRYCTLTVKILYGVHTTSIVYYREYVRTCTCTVMAQCNNSISSRNCNNWIKRPSTHRLHNANWKNWAVLTHARVLTLSFNIWVDLTEMCVCWFTSIRGLQLQCVPSSELSVCLKVSIDETEAGEILRKPAAHYINSLHVLFIVHQANLGELVISFVGLHVQLYAHNHLWLMAERCVITTRLAHIILVSRCTANLFAVLHVVLWCTVNFVKFLSLPFS